MKESQNIEFKQNWRDEYLKWICGFANAGGGKFFVGIDDKAKVVGIENHKDLLEQLPNKFRDALGVLADIKLHDRNAKFYLEINVPRCDVPISLRGKYYVRSGSTLQELTGLPLNEYILKRTGKTWDNIQEERATLDDIDLSTIAIFLKDAQKSKRIIVEDDIAISDLLDKLRLKENQLLKRVAIILFGKDPGRFYPNLAVKIGKFGVSDADIRFHEVLEGNLIQLQKNIVGMLHAKFFIHPIEFVGMQRIERDEYPEVAIREMILNALVHRNYIGAPTQIRLYEDSFSVWNHGLLPEGIREEDLWVTHRSVPRNPLIADVCFKGGYIDIWGSGTIRIIDACKQGGFPEPKLIEEQGGFLSEILKDAEMSETNDLHKEKYVLQQLRKKYRRNAKEIQKKYGRNSEEVIAWMHDDPIITMRKIADNMSLSQRTIEREVKKLKNAGLIERMGPDKTGYWKVKWDSDGVNDGVNDGV